MTAESVATPHPAEGDDVTTAAEDSSPRWVSGLLRGPSGMIRATQGVLLLLAAVLAAVSTTGAGAGLRDLVTRVASPALVLGTAALFALAAHHERPRPAAAVAWWCLAAAHLSLACGLVFVPAAHQPSRDLVPVQVWDLLYLGYYPLVGAALVALLRYRRPRWLPPTWPDSLVVAVGTLAVGVAALDAVTRDPTPTEHGFATLRPLATGGYALADLLLLAAVLGATATATGRFGLQARWFALGLALVTSADCWFTARESSPGAHLLWLAGPVVTGLASTTLGEAALGDRRRSATPENPDRAVLLPMVAVLAALTVLGCAVLTPLSITRWSTGPALLCILLGTTRLATHNWQAHVYGQLRGPRSPARRGADRTDEVTGLANRRAFAEALSGQSRSPQPARGRGHDGDDEVRPDHIALLLVDLDRFKEVNDALGHDAGDRLLAAVADRLAGALRPSQLLARLGGDEFAVVLPGADEPTAARVAAALRASLIEPFQVEGTRLHVRASVGLAVAAIPQEDPGDLLRRADVAMYRAKQNGTGVEPYRTADDRAGTQRLRRIDELREALARGELEVHLQPQVDLRRGVLVGAEALARWRHPQDGVLLPELFLPLAAQTGLMRPVTRHVLDRAMAACAQWWRRGHRIPVSVNLTADDLRDDGLPRRVDETLARYGLPGRALHLEITEDALLTDPQATAVLLEKWREKGVLVSIDDYGTGYSSLAYLRQLPVEEVKLDRIFAADLMDRRTATIVRHTVAMAHGLGLRVVAEGIEDEPTARQLADLGCDVGQGLYFGDALALPEFLELLASRRG